MQRAPDSIILFKQLTGTIDASTMIGMNAEVKLSGKNETKEAANFLNENL